MIIISENLINGIKAESEKYYPNECCGIIFGKICEDTDIKYGESTRSIINTFDENEKYHRFLISSEDMMYAELYSRKNNIDVVGFYHSHPDCQAVASEYDRAHALPVYSYIIVSVEKGKAVDVKSWELNVENETSVFHSEKIIIKENI